MFVPTSFTLLALFALARSKKEPISPQFVAHLMKDLTLFDRGFELHFMSNAPVEVYKELSSNDMSVTLTQPAPEAKAVFKPFECIPVEGRPIYGNVDKYAKLIVVWGLSNATNEEGLEVLRGTVTKGCPADVRPGVFRAGNLITFIGANPGEIFDNDETKRHEHVATFNALPKEKGLMMKRYDIYTDQIKPAAKWTVDEKPFTSLESMFPLLPMLGYTLRASSIPFGFLTDAIEDTNPENPKKRFSEQEGYEVVLVKTACEILDCKIEFSNPVDMLWGTVDNGSFTGHFGDLASGQVDFVMTGIILTYYRALVSY